LVGIIAMFTAGSVAAERMNPPQPWHYFFLKMLPWYGIGLVTLFAASMMPRKWIVGISAANVAVCFMLLLVTIAAPVTIKGSHRWVSLFGFSVMPSDLIKPGFIIMTAWFLARMKRIAGDDIFLSKRAWRMDGWPAYLALFLPGVMIIFFHPDVGTMLLYMAVFGIMIFIAGAPWKIIGVLAAGAAAALGAAFLTMSHVHHRIMNLFGQGGEGYQVKQSLQSIQHGGLLGSGDDSFVKQSLPDAHTDFVYAALSEDYGAILAVLLLFVLIYVMRRLIENARRAHDRFVFFAAAGAFALFGTQVCINLMSTLHIFAPKGMTLPFISYGGSSFVAFCLLFGMVLALVREDRWK
ncbi:MAG: FtsW/RodA/SpoVE family cell cycle protein, partial [Proteobacteria bacterium]|nr:FtsW/RodA/SpoVE family cell cycle protein [Pseudomonadota bacterium]